jgi:hypothetical protein
LAILILIAPIATLNSVEQQTLRIAIMPFFCLILAASAQLMGPSAMPLFLIVIGLVRISPILNITYTNKNRYFQTMIVFVSNQ